MDPKALIRICGMCGRQDIMTKKYVKPKTPYDYKLMDAEQSCKEILLGLILGFLIF